MMISEIEPMENGPRKTRVLLVEDHPMMRERLAQLINNQEDMEVCGEAKDSRTALALIREKSPGLAIVDISLHGSSGFELLHEIQAQAIPVPVLVLSMHDEPIYAQRALEAGARGYLPKSESSSELVRALRKILEGSIYLNEPMTSEMIQRMSGQSEDPGAAVASLTQRELELFRLIGQGKNTHEIARTLDRGESTIATLRTRLKDKIGAKDMAELYHRATEWAREQQDFSY